MKISRLKPAAACKLCAVEVNGGPKPLLSCCIAVKEGMEVKTNTDVVRLHFRKEAIEKLLKDHPDDCLTCEMAGDCNFKIMLMSMVLKEKIIDHYFKK